MMGCKGWDALARVRKWPDRHAELGRLSPVGIMGPFGSGCMGADWLVLVVASPSLCGVDDARGKLDGEGRWAVGGNRS